MTVADDSEDGDPRSTGNPGARGGRSRPRLRLACNRCQRRKIRCDGALPTCSSCRNAGTQCMDGASLRMRDLPRAHITALHSRINWLESIVRIRCPDIDLSQEAPVVGAEMDTQVDLPNPEPPRGGDAQQSQSHDSPETTSSNIDTTVSSSNQNSRSAKSGARHYEQDRAIGGSSVSAHQIGLISLGNSQDPRYIGPSSGYFLARVLLASAAKGKDGFQPSEDVGGSEPKLPFPCELIESMQGPLPMPSKASAEYLCSIYFELIHVQYPILHEPTFTGMLDQMYQPAGPDPIVAFQVFMVLAIGASIGSRRSRPGILGDSYGISAMRYFDQINVENSLKGLQCLLLLSIYAMHNPSARINIWHLNYQCLAALLDMGLQRSINTSSGISLFEQEMRTRLFWSVYTLDRTIATMMGRPLGIRDEACELRFPQDIPDSALTLPNLTSPNSTLANSEPTHMSYAIQLFQLARINSEIKYVANSVVSVTRDIPSYARPTVVDINAWQADVLQRLDSLVEAFSVARGGSTYAHIICQLRYHNIRMLLLSPSPAIPRPSPDLLAKSHSSAVEIIRLCNQLYRRDMLVASWTSLHCIVLSAITMFYCIRMVSFVAFQTELDILMNDVSTCLSMLSAIGEHWSGAKRCRETIEDLGRSTVSFIKNLHANRDNPAIRTSAHHHLTDNIPLATADGIQRPMTPTSLGAASFDIQDATFATSGASRPPLPAQDPFGTYLAGEMFGESVDIDYLMSQIFEDFISWNQNGV